VLIVGLYLMFIGPIPGHAAGDVRDVGATVFRADVFVNDGGTLVNPTATTPTNAPLYNVAGAPLNLTWAQWQLASATAEAHTTGGINHPQTVVRVQMKGLVPGGAYSVYYATFGPDTTNPYCPGVEHALPLTAANRRGQSPDAASFVADANGLTDYKAKVDANLLGATKVIYYVIYHYDGQTYDPLPNRGESLTQGNACRSSYGDDAGRQILILQKG
jgi:hypothetical protein